jgi:iron complex transport system ATP-binding protein
MAYVPQTGVPNSPFSVETFVNMGRYPYQGLLARPNGQDRLAVDEALDLTDTTFLRDRPLHTLSGGERQRVILAAALAQEARILLLDEPTVFLDPRHEAVFYAVLTQVQKQRDLTMITATHDLNRAVLMHDHVLALKQGRVLLSGPPVAFMTRTVLQDVYDNPFLLISHPENGHPMVLPEAPA